MKKKEKDTALFVAFCIEEYGAAKRMTGEQVLDFFSRYGVIDYLVSALIRCIPKGGVVAGRN